MGKRGQLRSVRRCDLMGLDDRGSHGRGEIWFARLEMGTAGSAGVWGVFPRGVPAQASMWVTGSREHLGSAQRCWQSAASSIHGYLGIGKMAHAGERWPWRNQRRGAELQLRARR